MAPVTAEGFQRPGRPYCRPLNVAHVEAKNDAFFPEATNGSTYAVRWHGRRWGNGISDSTLECELLMQANYADQRAAQSAVAPDTDERPRIDGFNKNGMLKIKEHA